MASEMSTSTTFAVGAGLNAARTGSKDAPSGLPVPPASEEKPPLPPEAPIIVELPDDTVRISWNELVCPVLVNRYSLGVRLRDGPWLKADAGVSPAVLVRSNGKRVRAPATEVIVAEMAPEVYKAAVYAKNRAGWSAASPFSIPVRVGMSNAAENGNCSFAAQPADAASTSLLGVLAE